MERNLLVQISDVGGKSKTGAVYSISYVPPIDDFKYITADAFHYFLCAQVVDSVVKTRMLTWMDRLCWKRNINLSLVMKLAKHGSDFRQVTVPVFKSWSKM